MTWRETEAVAAVSGYLRGAGRDAWVVGGTVRDIILGGDPGDIDLVTGYDPRETARAFADSISGSYFSLSEEFRLCRVISPSGVRYDFARMRGDSIEADLLQRDFTVNALAVPIPGGGSPIDPCGGLGHISAGLLAPVSETIFAEDPLRLLRAVRLEKQLGFGLAPELAQLARRYADQVNEPAPERRFHELVAIIEAPGTGAALRRLDQLGLLAVLLPELKELQGVTQNDFHHLDVFDHILAAADELGALLKDPEAVFPGAGGAIGTLMAEPVDGDCNRRQALSLAAVLHDIAKLECRFTDEAERVRFIDHDRLGGAAAGRILGRFRAGRRTMAAVRQLVRQHMWLVSLVQAPGVSERARLRFLRDTEPYTVETILLSVADRLAVRGPRATSAEIDRHLAFARDMLDRQLAAALAPPPAPLLTGGEIIAELGLAPGPVIGRIAAALMEEQRLGNIGTRAEALALARELADREG